MTNGPKTAKTRSDATDNFDSSSSSSSITAAGGGDNDGGGGDTQIKNKKTNCFVPLESNPDALNKLLSLMGFDVNQYCFVDVISFDESILDEMVPKPVVGILLAMPSSSPSNDSSFECSIDDDYKHIWHASQIIGGSCCSLAVLHLIMNLIVSMNRQIDSNINNNKEFSSSIGGLVKQNSWLEQQFIMMNKTTTTTSTTGNNSKERGMVLASDIEFAKIHHTVAASTPSINETSYSEYPKGQRTGTHFISFVPIHKVNKNYDDNENNTSCDDNTKMMMLMSMVELDGRKKFPIIHGDTSMGSFLEDACKLIRNDIINNKTNHGENIKFSVLALAACSRT